MIDFCGKEPGLGRLSDVMARNPDAPSRMEVLILSSLARTPMHGYDLKLELRYKHVRWWAKCEHGHLYAALARLERRGFIRRLAGRANGQARRRVYALTAAGRRRVRIVLGELGAAPDATYFDLDLFLAGAWLLDRRTVLKMLARRRTLLQQQLAEARELRQRMSGFVPKVARLIMDHRVGHLEREVAFTVRSLEALRTQSGWGPFLGAGRIDDFIERTGVPLESSGRR